MLNREQLEDAAMCNGECHQCKAFDTEYIDDIGGCSISLAITALELLDKTESQQKEIEQLKVQNAAMREAYEKIHDAAFELLPTYITDFDKTSLAKYIQTLVNEAIGGGHSEETNNNF